MGEESVPRNAAEQIQHDDVGYEIIISVDRSWNRIRSIPNYEMVAGEIMFRKIFELAPSALGMYSFGPQFIDDPDGLYSSPLFQRHAKGVVKMLDAAIQMLGPDMEPLSKVLKELGARHAEYGVLPPHYAVVGQALLFTLETALGEMWTPLVQKGWEAIFYCVSTSMMEGAEEFQAKQVAEKSKEHFTAMNAVSAMGEETEVYLSETQPGGSSDDLFDVIDAVDSSWNYIRDIPNYEAVAGELLFRKIFELAPGALGMFSFGRQFMEDIDGLYSSPLFQIHAKGVVKMLDAAIQMLGPDMEPLSKTLKELGARHTEYGVLPSHYAVVGQALMYTLETALGDKWTPSVRKGWEAIYLFVSTSMMGGAGEFLAKQVAKGKEQQKQVSKIETTTLSSLPRSDRDPASTLAPRPLRRRDRRGSLTSVKSAQKVKADLGSNSDHCLVDYATYSITAEVKPSISKSSNISITQNHHPNRGLLTWIDKALKITASAEIQRYHH